MSDNMDRATRQADRAIELVERNNNDLNPGWTDEALVALRQWLRIACGPFTMEQARIEVEALMTRAPTDRRVWGAVTRQAVKAGLIIAVFGKFARAASSNGSPKQVYVRGYAADRP